MVRLLVFLVGQSLWIVPMAGADVVPARPRFAPPMPPFVPGPWHRPGMARWLVSGMRQTINRSGGMDRTSKLTITVPRAV